MTSSTLARFAKPAHKAAARSVLDTLVIGDQEAFAGLSLIVRARLTPLDRRALAWAALRACDNEEVVMVVEAMLPPDEVAPEGAGAPLPPFDSPLEEAAFWASMASGDEVQAYLVVCFESLSVDDQSDFLAFAQTRRRAA